MAYKVIVTIGLLEFVLGMLEIFMGNMWVSGLMTGIGATLTFMGAVKWLTKS